VSWTVGSRWLRWDPHIHAPGTLRNDQFADHWTAYFEAIERADPPVAVLGITDYYSLASYEAFRQRLTSRPVPSLSMVFPNVEMRLTVNTRRGGAINVHLLVSPEDTHHVRRMKALLSQIKFKVGKETYQCTDEDLRRLGRDHEQNPRLDDAKALSAGANQFKAELSAIRELLTDGWAEHNVLFAPAAGQDGLGGLDKDSGWAASRKDLGVIAHLIFSGQQNDIDYWLRRNRSKPNTAKPCLHGSDAHEIARVLQPVDDKLCWIRGDASFESLRQAIIEPEHRVFIGSRPPTAAARGDVITELRVAGATWLGPTELALNDGLVTIIGAKGSGKTALADLIALSANSLEDPLPDTSFLKRASARLGSLKVTASWGDGSETSGSPGDERIPWLTGERVQYLSQQFVDRLASPEELGEPLVREIERVVFSAIPAQDRLQATDFRSLRALRMRGLIEEREAAMESIQVETGAWLVANDLAAQLPALIEKAAETARNQATAAAELKRVQPSGDPAALAALEATASVIEVLRAAIATEDRRLVDLRDTKAKIQRLLDAAVRDWQKLQAAHRGLLSTPEWELLRPRVDPAGLAFLDRSIAEATTATSALRATGVSAAKKVAPSGLTDLEAKRDALTAALGLDAATVRRRTQLQGMVSSAKLVAQAAAEAVKAASTAPEARDRAATKRLDAYEALFGTFALEEDILRDLYRPLDAAVRAGAGAGALRLEVARVVDLRGWAEQGEALLDLRTGPFQRHGSLEQVAGEALVRAWRKGSPTDVRAAMAAFLGRHLAKGAADLARGATARHLGEWLFAVDHVRVGYELVYQGQPIAQLSTGTRGVVLLTLYLALDDWDRRPLVIDQPEENLDPKSVFTILVPFFKAAARRRQIIMVTHNANLVVNTDSDQVIIATAKREAPGRLPKITYFAGALEDGPTRDEICDLLEGGEDAFRRRSERYGLN